MSNFLAIATVTAALQRLLQSALNADVSGGDVTAVRPDGSDDNTLPDPGINVYLYQVTPNTAWRNADLPTRAPDGRLVQRPRMALDLHYLLTFYGTESDLEPQRCLGSAVRALHATPVLTRSMIQDTIADPLYSSILGTSNLADEIETVKFNPLSLSLEELSKLWSVFFQTAYSLSVAYIGSVVLIEGTETPQPALPVQMRNIFALPSLEGARVPVVQPDELDDLQLWLKSDAGVTYDSDGVSAWDDQSGNANNAVQSVDTRRPAFVGHGIAGKPVLHFDGADDYLAIENLNYSTSGALPGLTVCALVRSLSTERQIIASFDNNEYWQLAMKDGTNENVGWDTRASTGGPNNMRSPDAYTDGQWHLICGWFDASVTPDKRLYIDGEVAVEDTAHGGNAIGRGSTRFGFIGIGSEATSFDGNTGPDWFFAGDIAELLIYHRALSDEERQQVERYFIDRYQ